MRRLSAIILTLSLGLLLPGCSLFKKNTNSGAGSGGSDAPANNSNVPPPKFPTAETPKSDPLTGGASKGQSGNGMLAGRVLDGTSRPPGGTSILVIPADAKDESAGRELAVSPEGYFTAENLSTGGQYKLIARGKTGDRVVAGIHYATAPNVHVLIQMKEDYVSSTTPALQGPFGSLKDNQKFEPILPQIAKEISVPVPPKSAWQPAVGVDVASGEVSLPTMQVAVRPDGFQQNGSAWIPPPLEIKPPQPQTPQFAKITPGEIPTKTIETPPNLGSAQVPSCVLVGRQLVNFALNDINGEAWELKANRKGKLVLLDFWGTWCPPCRQTMPTLKGLQTKYGGQGFDVVGIAYEREGTPQEQAYKVNEVCQKLLINYRQLLGSGDSCVVKTQLRVRAYPTLILIDEQGNELWRHVGVLETNSREELERIIQTRVRTTAAF